MLFTRRALPSSSAAIFIMFSVVLMTASSEFCSTIPSCNCSNNPDGYELRCLTSTVQVKPKAFVRIQCDNNVVSDFPVLNIGEVDTLVIRLCPLPSVSLNQLMQRLGVTNVSNVQLAHTTLPSRMLADIATLKIVAIRNCNMSTLPEDLLWGSASIHTLSLNNNAFITLPETLFKDCGNLQSLDISYNRISVLPNGLFSNVKNLTSLKMNNNQLSVITNQLFSSLTKLVVLDLKDNRLTHVETQAFKMLSSLTTVNMSNNVLTFEDTSANGTMDFSPLKFCKNLRNVQLENNSLIRIFPDWINLWRLDTLNLAYNKISLIRLANIKFLCVNDISVNVSYNNISEIDTIHDGSEQFGLVYYPHIYTKLQKYIMRKEYKDLPVIHIFVEGNFINCDCKVPTIVLDHKYDYGIFEIVMETNPGNLQCAKRNEYRDIVSQILPLKIVSCLYKKRHNLNCPEECSCLSMSSNKYLLVDCNQRNRSSMIKEDMLHNLSRAAFTGTHSLEVLEIDSLKMHTLPSDLLLDLTELRFLNLCRNEFLSLPLNLFVNNRNLITVNIVDNRRTLSTLPPGLLANLTKLREVTLRSCNTSTLPEDLLWGSWNIREISLNRNAFTTLPERLFKNSGTLLVLDISYNRITHLPNGLFSGIPYLWYLRINNNQLTTISNNLFSSLPSLRVLDLKDNRLRHIKSEAFIGSKELRILDMSNNLLTFTDTSVIRTETPLKFCDKLEELQLANNSVTKIFVDWREFRKLKTLNLAYNKISQIKAEDIRFAGAKNTFVNVSYNNITDMNIFENNSVYKYVSGTAVYNVTVREFFIEGNPTDCGCKVYRFLQYDGQNITAEIKITIEANTSSSLQCVGLEAYSGQVIRKIPRKHFTCLLKTEYRLNCPEQCRCLLFPLTKSMVIECQQTNVPLIPAREDVLQNLSRDVFSDLHNLEYLDIKWNRMISLPPDLFVDLIKLRKISIYASEFQSLPQNLFVNNTNLEIINIENNGVVILKTLPPRFLAGLTKLKEVKLNSCNISKVPEDLLWGSTSINTISLKNNALTTLPEHLFIECSELMTVDISFNRITDLPDELFSTTRNLKILKINNNQLTSIGNYLFYLNKLEILDLKYNRLSKIGEAFRSLYSLKTVDMSNNMLTYEEEPWPFLYFKHSPNLEDIQLAYNSITRLFLEWRQMGNLQSLNLAHNKISYLMPYHLAFDSTKNIFVNLTYNNIYGIEMFSENNDVKHVPETGIHNMPVRHIFIEGNPINCDCKTYRFLQYPKGILKDINFTTQVNLIFGTEPNTLQCVNHKGHTEQLDGSIPMEYLTCFYKKGYNLNCPEQCSCLFRTSDKALRVDCQQRNLTTMPAGLPHITFSNYTELNLSRNRIESIKCPLGPGYSAVTKYILSNNMISEIDLTAFSPNLETLELDGNRITQFNNSSIEFLTNSTFLTQLTLHNNPWRCDCTTKHYVNVIQSFYHWRKIKILGNITCENGKELLKISGTELCPIACKIFFSECYIAAIFGILFGLLIGCLLVFCYKFQKCIKIWLYAHGCCLRFVREEEIDQEKSYDVFVSYAHKDEEFVMDHLVPRLEDEHYTLCLHQGEFTPAQIARSVETSRRTLIILSTGFLESVWSATEFRVAHEQALRDAIVRVIVILYGDIGPIDKLDSELRQYITMNTCVKWGDKWFWEKLRYAMPHSSKVRTWIPLQERT